MRFKDFLSEISAAQIARWTPKKLSDEDIIAWCEKNAQHFLAQTIEIYRGTNEGLTGLLDTTKLKRQSMNGFNHHTLWVDNAPEWSNFPKRSESIICTGDEETAKTFGDAQYLIIPEDMAWVGICPEGDFWFSFPAMDEVFSDISQLGEELDIEGVKATSFKTLVAGLNKLTPESTENENLLALMDNTGAVNMFDALTTALDPDTNGFSCRRAGDGDVGAAEVWVSGNVMQVELDTMSPTLKEFFKGKGYAL
jgi:hypothetical protein